MPTQQQVEPIIAQIRDLIVAAGMPLGVAGGRLDDTWLTVIITSQQGIRASDYANFMSEIERELRRRGYDEVVLVPALAG